MSSSDEQQFIQQALARVEKEVIVSVSFVVMVCTTKIMGQSSKNTLAILRAIAADRNKM